MKLGVFYYNFNFLNGGNTTVFILFIVDTYLLLVKLFNKILCFMKAWFSQIYKFNQ